MRRADLAILCLALAAPVARAQDTTMVHVQHMQWGRTTFLLVDELELRTPFPSTELGVDLMGWVGGPLHRLWLKADGSVPLTGAGARTEWQLLYGRMIAPFWDLQLGKWANTDVISSSLRARGGVALGLQGLAPGWFDVESALLLDIDARLTAQLTASHDLYLTQRFIVQPRVETSFAAQPDRLRAIGAGVGPTEYALRLRYELRREFAPYIGLVREARYGETARLRPAADRTELALGFRLWF